MGGVTAVVPENSTKQHKLVPGRPFAKGQTGNPGGRPKVAKGFRDMCKEFMDVEGWRILLDMAQQPARDQLPALTLIASYAYGKPTQPISGEDGGPIEIVVRQLEADVEREKQRLISRLVSPEALALGDGGQAEPEDTFG